jgi:hypothetical protein
MAERRQTDEGVESARRSVARWKRRNPKKVEAQRRREAERNGREYGLRRAQAFSRAQDRLAGQNARQAWRYWMNERAPDWWVERYWEAVGRPWGNPRLSDAEAYRLRYRLDSDFALAERIRRQIKKAQKKDGIGDVIRYALVRGGRSNRTEALLGYSIAELRDHLERQLTAGMTWQAFAEGRIHIDHIVPQSAFDLNDEEQWRQCWALSNLRPLWAEDNLRKSCRIEALL